MAQITGGKVVFTERRQISQFEPREGTVELSFQLFDGEEYNAALSNVTALARAKCYELMGLTEVKLAAPVAAAVAEKHPLADKPVEAAPEAKKRGRPPKTAVPDEEPARAATPTEVKEALASTGMDADLLGLPTPPKPEAKAAPATPAPPSGKVIGDLELQAATRERMKATMNPKAIKGLTADYSESPLQHVSGIPQEKRGEFLEALSKIAVAK